MVQQENKSINPRKKCCIKKYRVDSSHIDLKCRLKYLQSCLNTSIEVAKENYYYNTVNKLMDNQKNYKVYWSLLKLVINNKKKPVIPPLFYENRFIRDFKGKDQFLNIFFPKQCFHIPNNSSSC